ncbi:hypothetical protein CLU79DRAFT_739675 [Phycomyces nitens]|nr:hypothetical protein CLU79DRAFT_739675 [Phycomyces nitens]
MKDVMSTIDDSNIVLETLANYSSCMKNKPLEKQPTCGTKVCPNVRERIKCQRTNCSAMAEKLRRDWQSAYQKINQISKAPKQLDIGTQSALDQVDYDPQVTVCDVVESLTRSFEEFSLTKSLIHKHMNETCNPPVKKKAIF